MTSYIHLYLNYLHHRHCFLCATTSCFALCAVLYWVTLICILLLLHRFVIRSLIVVFDILLHRLFQYQYHLFSRCTILIITISLSSRIDELFLSIVVFIDSMILLYLFLYLRQLFSYRLVLLYPKKICFCTLALLVLSSNSIFSSVHIFMHLCSFSRLILLLIQSINASLVATFPCLLY